MPELSLTLLLPAAGLAGAMAWAAAGWLRARSLARELSGLRTESDRMRNDLAALLRCSRGMGEQLRRQQALVRRLNERQAQVERGDGSARVQAAETLLRNGADVAEIASRCGMSRGEAELLVHLEDLRRREARAAA